MVSIEAITDVVVCNVVAYYISIIIYVNSMDVIALVGIVAKIVHDVAVVGVVATGIVAKTRTAWRTTTVDIGHVMDVIALYQVVGPEVIYAIRNACTSHVKADDMDVASVIAHNIGLRGAVPTAADFSPPFRIRNNNERGGGGTTIIYGDRTI